jgi:hypothetical protein
VVNANQGGGFAPFERDGQRQGQDHAHAHEGQSAEEETRGISRRDCAGRRFNAAELPAEKIGISPGQDVFHVGVFGVG